MWLAGPFFRPEQRLQVLVSGLMLPHKLQHRLISPLLAERGETSAVCSPRHQTDISHPSSVITETEDTLMKPSTCFSCNCTYSRPHSVVLSSSSDLMWRIRVRSKSHALAFYSSLVLRPPSQSACCCMKCANNWVILLRHRSAPWTSSLMLLFIAASAQNFHIPAIHRDVGLCDVSSAPLACVLHNLTGCSRTSWYF